MNCPSLRNSSVLHAALLAAGFLTTAHAQLFTSLGEFPVADPNYITSLKIAAVSNNGRVVGTGYVGLSNRAFSWSPGGGFELLGTLPGGAKNWANGISDDGTIVIGASASASGVQATRWTQGGGTTGLGSLPGYGSNATAVSGDGSTIWGTSTLNNNEVGTGPGWRLAGGGTLVGVGPDVAVPFDASGDGVVIVGAKVLNPYSGTPVRWDSAGNATLLGPPPDPMTGGAAYAVSSDGQTIVGANLGQAVMWNGSGVMVPIGQATGTLRSNYATDVNQDGSIIVGVAERFFNSNASALDAFVWTPEIGLRRMVDAVANDPLLHPALAGWTLYEADAISANGRYITGWGRDPDGNFQGWMLDRGANPAPFTSFVPVPEPSLYGPVAALVLGATLLRGRRLRWHRPSDPGEKVRTAAG